MEQQSLDDSIVLDDYSINVELVKELMKEKGFTKARDLSVKCGVDVSQINRILSRGTLRPRIDTAMRMADALGKSNVKDIMEVTKQKFTIREL